MPTTSIVNAIDFDPALDSAATYGIAGLIALAALGRRILSHKQS